MGEHPEPALPHPFQHLLADLHRPSFVDIIRPADDSAPEIGIARKRTQGLADQEINIEFWRIATAQRLAGDLEAFFQPIDTEIGKVEPIGAPPDVKRIVARQPLGEFESAPKLNIDHSRLDGSFAGGHPILPPGALGFPSVDARVRQIEREANDEAG